MLDVYHSVYNDQVELESNELCATSYNKKTNSLWFFILSCVPVASMNGKGNGKFFLTLNEFAVFLAFIYWLISTNVNWA